VIEESHVLWGITLSRCCLCDVENFITVLTPAVYDYQYLPEVAVSKKSHVTFRVRAAADAHIALSMAYGDTHRKTYEVALGMTGNSISAIRYGGRGLTVTQVRTPDLLEADDFKHFWISWDSDVLEVSLWLTSNSSVCLITQH